MTAGSPPVPPLVNFAVSNNVIDGTNTTSDWWWFQMGGVQTQTLTPGFTLMAGSPFSNIGVANNFIADAGRSAVWLGNANSGSISGNYLLGPNARPESRQRQSGEARRRGAAARHRYDFERHLDGERHRRPDFATAHRHRHRGTRAGRVCPWQHDAPQRPCSRLAGWSDGDAHRRRWHRPPDDSAGLERPRTRCARARWPRASAVLS